MSDQFRSVNIATKNDGDAKVAVVDGTANSGIGASTDTAATGNGSVIGILKQLRVLLAGGLPSSLGQKTSANSLAVVLSSDQSAIPVTGGGLTSAVKSRIKEAALAAGATSAAENHTAVSSGKTQKLMQLVFSGTVSGKVELYGVRNSVVDTNPLVELFISPTSPNAVFTPADKNFFTIVDSAGTDNFRTLVYNLDNSVAADFYVNLLLDEV